MIKKLVLLTILLSGLMSFAQAPVIHQTTLAWLPSPDAAANPTLTYNMYRVPGSCPADGSFPLASATQIASALTGTTFIDTAVSVSKTFCYSVTASLNGLESVPSVTSQATTPLGRPTGLSASGK
jgi:hypothetical protein